MSEAAAASKAGRIVVRCTCGKKLGAPPAAAGKAIKCPKCGQRVPVPKSDVVNASRAKPLPATGRSDHASDRTPHGSAGPTHVDADGRIKVVCTCGKKIRVPAAGAGKKGKCPACGAMFRVPDLAKKPQPPAPSREKEQPRSALFDEEPEPDTTLNLLDEVPSDDLGGGLFGELETQSATGARDPGVVSAIKCPHCHGMIVANSVRCPLCGNNPAKPPKAKKSRERSGSSLGDHLTGAGSALAALSLGTLFSCIGAAIGAALWVGVAMAIGLELGYIAWILGGLTGYGMILGTKSQSVIAGLAASAIAFLAILVAKIAIIFLVLFPQIIQQAQAMAGGGGQPVDQMTEMRGMLITEMTDEELEAKGYDPYGRRSQQYYVDQREIQTANIEKVNGWTDEQVLAEIKRREQKAAREMEEAEASWHRRALASHLAEKELKDRGVDSRADDYLDQLQQAQDEKMKEVESWSDEKFNGEYEKYESERDAELRRSELADYMTDDELEAKGIEGHMPSYYQQYDDIHAAKMAELESWSNEKVSAELERRDTEAAEELAASATGLGDVPASEWAMLFILFFDPMGLFITLIAMGTAFWVGYGGFERV